MSKVTEKGLQPCPHCRHLKKKVDPPVVVYGNEAYVECPNCKMRGPGVYPDIGKYAEAVDRNYVIQAWNSLPWSYPAAAG